MAEPTTTTAAASSPYPAFDGQYIGGEWRPGRAGRTYVDRDPYTDEPIAEIALANQADLNEAYQAAAAAQPEWAAMLPGDRADVMRRAAAIMEDRHEEIIDWLIRESGSTRLKASLEWDAVYGVLQAAATMPSRVEGRIIPADVPGKESRVYRRPVGVMAVISPWNWPLQLTARSLFPALAVGNAVVVKPASDTPITGGLLHARILEEAGLPPGLCNVVVGPGSEIGDAIVTHDIPRLISFTGSTPVGRRIARLAMEAPIMKRIELELGGNSPFIVLGDADLDHAVEAAVFGKFLHQGQICMSINRLIIDDSVYEPFVEQFAERVRALKYGDPHESDTVVGPIINDSQLQGLRDRIEEGRQAGARQLVGGEPEGRVLPPHVFADVDNDQLLAREELFGPVAPIIRARGEEEAVRMANGTPYGLSSAIFTGDVERGVWLASRIEAGMTHINDQPVNDLPFSPFGGEKSSGIGRFNGDWAMDAFTTDHWVTVQHALRDYPFDATLLRGPWAGG